MQARLQEIVSAPGEGRKVSVFGTLLTIRVASATSGGDFAVWEDSGPPGYGPPRHLHLNVDEAFQVLDGHYRVWCDGRSYELGPGAMAMVPKGTPHAFRCLGPGPGRLLTTVVPGGMDDFFIEIEARGFRLPEDIAQLIELGRQHGHEFVGPPLSE